MVVCGDPASRSHERTGRGGVRPENCEPGPAGPRCARFPAMCAHAHVVLHCPPHGVGGRLRRKDGRLHPFRTCRSAAHLRTTHGDARGRAGPAAAFRRRPRFHPATLRQRRVCRHRRGRVARKRTCLAPFYHQTRVLHRVHQLRHRSGAPQPRPDPHRREAAARLRVLTHGRTASRREHQ